MKTMIVAAALMLATGARAQNECAGPELQAGTVLPDGTVAGEKEAFDHLRAKDPELHVALSALSGPKLRARYGKLLVPFQRPGNCRTRQKAESIERLRSELGLGPAYNECAAQPELAAGTRLPDGRVAGERQALELFKEKEPELHAQLAKFPPDELRRRYARQLAPFQQVGNCRTRQKEESIRQLKAELEAERLAEEYRRSDATGKKALADKLRGALAELFDSDIVLLDHKAASLEQALEEYAREAKEIRAKLAARKKARERIIEKRLDEILKGS